MEKSKKRLIRQLERLKIQIDALKNNYQALAGSKAAPTQAKEKAAAPPAVSPGKTDTEKNRKLVELAMRTGKENDLYKAVNKKIEALLKSGKQTFSADDLKEIQQTLKAARGKTDNWELFRQKFTEVYPGFFEKLKAAYPGLTKTEIRFCAYLRSHLNSKQIASAMDISMEAIRKNRHRIRKKMALKIEDSLEETIEKF